VSSEGTSITQMAPRATSGKRKAHELDSSDSGGSTEPASRRRATGQISGAVSGRLPAQAKGSPAQDPAEKPKSTGEHAASSGRQLSYAEVSNKPSGTLKPTALPQYPVPPWKQHQGARLAGHTVTCSGA
jgi:hypothetical protein